MPRGPRFTLPNVPTHVVQRGNNRQACFISDTDFGLYLEWLEHYSQQYECAIHAYVLMTNHVHLLVTPDSAVSLSLLMKHLGQRYTQYVNRRYDRTGTLWEGRFRSSPILNDDYLLNCYRYIELNPVRAGMVSQPESYPHSSYRCNALGSPNAVVTPHPLYSALGRTRESRFSTYRALCESGLEENTLQTLQRATHGNNAIQA